MLLIKINKHGVIKNITKTDLTFLDKYKNVSHLYSWNFDTFEYKLFGSDTGNAGTENKYDLPPPIDSNLYFNDLYLCKIKNNIIFDLTIENYNYFYNTLFEGFEDILEDCEEITEELSEHTSDRNFIDDECSEISSEEYEEEAEDSNSLEISISDISITDTEENINLDDSLILSDDTLNNSLEQTELISSIEISISSSDSEEEEEKKEENINK